MPGPVLLTSILRLIGVLSATVLGAAGDVPVPKSAAIRCDRTTGPGRGAVQAMIDSLAPGQAGCLRGGVYRENVTVRRGGVAGAPITLQGSPGGHARLLGRLVIARGADHVTVRDLTLDGAPAPPDTQCTTTGGCGVLPSPTVDADGATFDNVDVTNQHRGICFSLGSLDSGRVHGTVIARSRIHDCGRLPATNHDHGIYVNSADGTRITDDWIYENADRGIQLYPDAQHTTIIGNVIVGNGEGVLVGSSNGAPPSSHNTIAHNVLTDSRLRWNLESWWNGGVGQGNVVRDNCVYATNAARAYHRNGGVQESRGLSERRNLITAPRFVDAARHDYRVWPAAPGTVSTCAS